MALYLGREKMAPILKGGAVSNSVKYITGTVTSDEDGIITFPELDFTPTMITVWNIEESDFEDPDAEYSCYNGVLVCAILINDIWIAQVAKSDSGSAYISNATYDTWGSGNSAIEYVNGQYQYHIDYSQNLLFANTEFNYAIYG